MANHLETLIAQFYDWKGWVVRRNVRVGKRPGGGFIGEVDVVVYNPESRQMIHYETGLDASARADCEARYNRKFEIGREYIFNGVLPWLKREDVNLKQIAVLFQAPKNPLNLQGAEIKSVDELVKDIRDEIKARGPAVRGAIPEQWDLLRTIQFVVSGYIKPYPC
jgi:hypothetical protein